jgi:hypothetical protein
VVLSKEIINWSFRYSEKANQRANMFFLHYSFFKELGINLKAEEPRE